MGTPKDKCRENNKNALANDMASKNRDNVKGGGEEEEEDDDANGYGESGYEESVFENLVYRYEEPNGMTRWDSPLFTVLYDDLDPPYDQIWGALIETDGRTKAVRPNQATVLVSINLYLDELFFRHC